MERLSALSFSILLQFEKCPYSTYLAKIKKIPQDFGPAADRGSQLHKDAENFLLHDAPLTADLAKHYRERFNSLKEHYKNYPETVHVEEDWCVDKNWLPTGWLSNDCWFRAKLDVLIIDHDDCALIIDYKSGKKFGNEIKHTQQGQVYMIHTFLRYPELKTLETQFWYLDQPENQLLTKTYQRQDLDKYLVPLEKRAQRVTDATVFPAKPNAINCKWCSFKQEHCQYAHNP